MKETKKFEISCIDCFQSEISEGVKESLKYEVDRTTYGNKMRDFQKWMIAVKKDTLYRVSLLLYCRCKLIINTFLVSFKC